MTTACLCVLWGFAASAVLVLFAAIRSGQLSNGERARGECED